MKSSSEIGRSSKAVVEYFFDCHVSCDEKWRRPKLNTRLKKKKEDSQSYYRWRKNKKLYTQIWNAYQSFRSDSSPRVASCIRHITK